MHPGWHSSCGGTKECRLARGKALQAECIEHLIAKQLPQVCAWSNSCPGHAGGVGAHHARSCLSLSTCSAEAHMTAEPRKWAAEGSLMGDHIRMPLQRASGRT